MSRESRERIDEDEYDELGKRIKREIDASSNIINGNNYYNYSPLPNSNSSNYQQNQQQMGIRRQMLGPPGTTLNTITPCAACKLLRRRCAEECPFSPYFSPHEPQKFAAVHKVFGASNVSKMLLEVPESQRADAANSLVYEANVRLRDPVHGCMGAISALQQQLQTLTAELNAVRTEIIKYKYRDAAAAAAQHSSTHHHHHHPHASAANNNNNNNMPTPGDHQPAPSPPPPPPPPRPPMLVVTSGAVTFQHAQQHSTPPPPTTPPPAASLHAAAAANSSCSSPGAAAVPPSSMYTPSHHHHATTTAASTSNSAGFIPISRSDHHNSSSHVPYFD